MADATPQTTGESAPPRPRLLPRLVGNLQRQNWTEVVIELVIVVLGVFLGLQATKWAADEADRKRGRDYLERLAVDLRADMNARQTVVTYFAAVEDSARRADALLAEADPDPTALVVNAYRATEQNFNPQQRATWDELVAAGHIGLLPRRVIEAGVGEYYSFDWAREIMMSMEASPYRRRVRSLLPHRVQTAIRERCGDRRDEMGRIPGFREDCQLGLSAGEIEAAAAVLKADPGVAYDLRYQFSTLATARFNLGGDVAFLRHVIAAVPEPKGDRR